MPKSDRYFTLNKDDKIASRSNEEERTAGDASLSKPTDTKDKISFLVQGSSMDPYLMTFVRRSGYNVSAYCTCTAWQNGQYCRQG